MFGNVVLDLAFAPWAMNTLFAASRLRVFTLLAEQPLTADQCGRLPSPSDPPV